MASRKAAVPRETDNSFLDNISNSSLLLLTVALYLFSDDFYQSACSWKCVWSPGGCLLCLPPGEMKKLGTHPVALEFPVFLDSALSRKKVEF